MRTPSILAPAWIIALSLPACGSSDHHPGASASCEAGMSASVGADCSQLSCRLYSPKCQLAPAIDRSVATTVSEAAAFLYTGSDPLQKQVDASVFDRKRQAMVRGKVVDASGKPLSGVKVSIPAEARYGYTVSRPDGLFDMAVNGGSRLVFKFEGVGYLTVERATVPGWQRHARLADVGMIEEAHNASSVSANASGLQIIEGDKVGSDTSAHQPVVFVPEYTSASAVFSDGTQKALDTFTVHVTEYPLDPGAARFSPGSLPSTSSAHYGVEFTVDQAENLHATRVNFSQPVMLYVENLLNLPVGSSVPINYYNRQLSQWQSTGNGQVLKVLSVANSTVQLDTDGDGVADDSSQLDVLGFSDSELAEVSHRYVAGSTLWRARVDHFSAYDLSVPVSAPKSASAPSTSGVLSRPLDTPTRRNGALVEPQASIGDVSLNGTQFSLHYQSNRTTAYGPGFQLEIPLIGDAVPSGLKQVICAVDIAGQHLEQTLDPKAALKQVVTWDGNDGFGRPLQGPQTASVTVGYVYPGTVNLTDASGKSVAMTSGSGATIPDAVLTQTFEMPLGAWDAKGYQLGGFSLDVLHAYDPAHQTVYYGWGDQRSAENVALLIKQPVTDFDLGTPDNVVVAPDGSIIVTDDQQNSSSPQSRVLHITPDGKTSVIAGPGAPGSAGNLNLSSPQGIVVKADGTIIFDDYMLNKVFAISPAGDVSVLISGESADNPVVLENLNALDDLALGPREELYIVNDGVVYRFEGGALSVFAGGGLGDDGGPATQALLQTPSGVAAAADGTVYISERAGNRIRKVLPDCSIHTVAGTGTAGFSGDGGQATLATMDGPRGVALSSDGSLYFADQNNNRIRRVTPDGLIQTVVGGGTGTLKDGQLADQVQISSPDGITFGKDGALYVAAGTTLYRVAPGLPELSNNDNLIPSADGRVLYKFDSRGKHQATLDAMTGVTELAFAYDDHGYLKSVTDKDGLVTAFVRDGSGNLSSVKAPFGQTSTLTLGANGFITGVTDPLSRTTGFTYESDTGLMSIITDPKGGTQKYEYASSRLLNVTDPTGYKETYGRTTDTSGYSISVSTPSTLSSTYSTHEAAGGVQTRSVVDPDKATATFSDAVEMLTSTAGDGTTTTTFLSPDPAFGAQSLFPTQVTVTTPSGRALTSYPLRAKQQTDIDNALSVTEWNEQVETNNRLTQTVYKKSDQSLTVTSPMGRITTTTLNSQGRPSDVTPPGLTPVHYDYDSSGRVIKATQTSGSESRTRSYQYDGSTGLLASETDSLGHTTSYTRDAAGRLTELTHADSSAIDWSLDNNDNVLSLTPPSRSAHQFAYTSDDLLQTATPPAVAGTAIGQTSYSYTSDLNLQNITRSDGRSIAFAYDAASGLLSTETLGSATLSFGYDASGKLTSINRSDGVKVTQGFDGPLWTGSSWSGAIKGSVSADYDENFWLSSITVNNASTVGFTYDNDGLLVGASDGTSTMTVSRDAASGLVSGSTLGSVTTTQANNAFGELTTLSAAISGASAFSQTLTRDSLGRVTHITETLGTANHETDYSYDSVGRLTEAKTDGVATDYTYDANGNRTMVTVDGVQTATGNYDAQDRVTSYGDANYVFSAQGDLQTKTSSTGSLSLTYDEIGNLMKAAVTNSNGSTKTISYVVDGFGRRVARQVNGNFDRAWLYRDSLRPVSEVDSAGIFSHYVYLSNDSAPDFMLRSGVPYRFIKDHLGSVRLVVNAQTGAVAQSIEYDAFGVVLSDSSPGFQPFAFAGGLYDTTTGLVRFGARDYDPSMGRWTNKDPIGFAGQQGNLYAYVGNDPVNHADPTGLASIEVTVIDKSDVTGWLAALVRFFDAVYMESAESMVSNVVHEAGNDKIIRLNILDHGNSDGFQLGNDFVTLDSLARFETALGRLRGRFAPGGFIHLQHCDVGQNYPLLVRISRITGVPVYAGTGAHNPLYRINFGHYVRCTSTGCVSTGRP